MDGGSTSSKIAVIDERGELIYRDYRLSEGNPIRDVSEMFDRMRAWKQEQEIQLDQFGKDAPAPADMGKPVQDKVSMQPAAADSVDDLSSARRAINSGDIEAALTQYSELIKSRQNLKTVIIDLEKAAEKYPHDTAVHRTLGDAYMRNHQINEAMQAYSKA